MERFYSNSPVGTTDHRQAVERIARNPCEKDMFIIYQSSVGATENQLLWKDIKKICDDKLALYFLLCLQIEKSNG